MKRMIAAGLLALLVWQPASAQTEIQRRARAEEQWQINSQRCLKELRWQYTRPDNPRDPMSGLYDPPLGAEAACTDRPQDRYSPAPSSAAQQRLDDLERRLQQLEDDR